jgi:membrane protein involved in colicin uptake
MQYTENYNLKLPDTTDFYNIADFNDNAQTIDEAMQATASSASTNAEAISKEASRAALAEQANAEAISAEVLRAKEKETVNANAIAAETKRAGEAETELSGKITAESERAAKAETEATAATTREVINRILLSGLEDGTKVFSDDGTVITSTASNGQTLTKTFTDSFTVMTVVLASAEGTEIARMVKTFSTDGKTISVTVTYAEG